MHVRVQSTSVETRWWRLARVGMVWYGMVWYGMVWYGMVWYGMVWYGMVEKCRDGDSDSLVVSPRVNSNPKSATAERAESTFSGAVATAFIATGSLTTFVRRPARSMQNTLPTFFDRSD